MEPLRPVQLTAPSATGVPFEELAADTRVRGLSIANPDMQTGSFYYSGPYASVRTHLGSAGCCSRLRLKKPRTAADSRDGRCVAEGLTAMRSSGPRRLTFAKAVSRLDPRTANAATADRLEPGVLHENWSCQGFGRRRRYLVLPGRCERQWIAGGGAAGSPVVKQSYGAAGHLAFHRAFLKT